MKKDNQVGLAGVTLVVVLTLLIGGVVVGGNDDNRPVVSHSAPAASVSACMDAVRGQLVYPSSASFSSMGITSRPLQGGGWAVWLDFKAQNGLGAMLPQRARCDVKGGQVVSVTVVGR